MVWCIQNFVRLQICGIAHFDNLTNKLEGFEVRLFRGKAVSLLSYVRSMRRSTYLPKQIIDRN